MKKPATGTYPNYIRKLREKKGLSQEPLWKALGVTQPTFSALENGQTRLTPQKAEILAQLLDCGAWELAPEFENFGGKNRAIHFPQTLNDDIIVQLAIEAGAQGKKPSEKIIEFAQKSLKDWLQQDRARGQSSSADHLVRLARTLLGDAKK